MINIPCSSAWNRAGKERENNMKNITVRFDDDIYSALKKTAAEIGITVNALLIVATWLHVLKQEPKRR